MTTTEHSDLAARLAALADEPAPPAAFDIATSIVRGRARLRHRRRAQVGAVAAATAAAVTAVLLLAPGGGIPTTRLLPAAPRTDHPIVAPATPIGTPTDPLVAGGTFGWLPDWLDHERNVGYQASQDAVVTIAGLGGPSGRSLSLLVHPAGPEPALIDSPTQKEEKEPALAVNGRTAYWVTNPTHPTYDSGRRVLRWQTTSGRWAQLISNRPRGTEIPDDVLLRVAADVQVGERAVPLPFWLSGLPAGLRPTEALLTRPAVGQPWTATVGLTLDDMSIGLIVAPDGEQRYGKSNTSCRSEQGLKICATVESESLPLAQRYGGLAALTELVHVTGVDPSTWTTDVIR
ncbi:hypothetical protein [Kitasatospora aureofaciens]|uniref:hypothetical protein n=1 Tax=Kitasatospora aureofaciens TaxID=1894 RepID=UPI001C4672C6|nr:hypothetical protein [Kitasatospora aureofaciens]MBV6702447.1 hypothetical protein [Kitasatospora aureofaciens]